MKTLRIYLVLGVIIVLLIVSHFLPLKGDTTKSKESAPIVNITSTDPKTAQKLYGCDISHWDGEIDWPNLKASGLSFLFIKATQGTTYIDPAFEDHWESAKNYGFYRGAYHFYQPHEDPKVQAAHFLSAVKPAKGDILPVLDIEIAHGQSVDSLRANVKVWVDAVKEAIGRYPIIYTDRAFWDAHIKGDFSYCPLWLAEWETSHAPYLPQEWHDWTFWQHSASGTVEGIPIKGKVDLDWFNGDLQRLASYRLK